MPLLASWHLFEECMKLKKILSSLSIILALSAFTTLSFPDDSEAKRFGGRRSVGRTITPKSTPPAGARVTQQRQNINQNQAVNGSGASAMNRTGMFGGMFGGLLAGTLLGSLFMGGSGGMAGAGGAGGIGFLDILLIGGIGFFAFRFFKSRSAKSKSHRESSQDYAYKQRNDRDKYQDTGSAWDQLRSEPTRQDTQYETNTQSESNNINVHIPASFDKEKFLPGAKALYVRMQESWDDRNLDDIEQFTTSTLFAEIREQFNDDPTPSKTEILLIDASVLEVTQARGEEHVSVLFDVNMREEGESGQVKEIWNFTKAEESTSWKLDGIQQI